MRNFVPKYILNKYLKQFIPQRLHIDLNFLIPSSPEISRRKMSKYFILYTTLIMTCKKSKIVSLTSIRMKTIHATSVRSRFAIKLICCIAFESIPGACCLFSSIWINFFFITFKDNITNNQSSHHLLDQ